MSENNKLESLMDIISENTEVRDEFTPAEGGSKPTEVSRTELKAMLNNYGEEEKETLFNNTNNTKVLGFCAKGPHIGKYVVEEMGRESLACDTKGEYFGKILPVKMPKNPSVPWDGFALQLPDGSTTEVRRDRMIDWLLSNTLGRVVGGDEGRVLRVVEKSQSKNTQGLNGQKSALTINRKGLSTSNPDHIIETYEIDTEADGTAKEGVTRTVALEAGEAVTDQDKKVTLRGKVTDFPQFRRKQEFIETLGQITSKKNAGKIHGGSKSVEAEDAFFEYLELLTKHNQA